MNKLTERAKSRKFLSFLFVLLVSTICLFIQWAEFAEWSTIVQWSMGFYFGANAVSRALNTFGGQNPPIEQTDER